MNVGSEPTSIDEFRSEQTSDRQGAVWSRWLRGERAFRIVTTIAIVEALMLIVTGISLSGVAGGSTGRLVVDSVPTGAEVRLDGAVVGVTPLSISAAEGPHGLEVRHSGNAQTITVPVTRGETTRNLVEFLAPGQSVASASSEIRITSEPTASEVSIGQVPPGTASDPGWIAIAAPTALRVLERGRLLGTTGGGPIALAPGTHELELVNEEFGLRLAQRVVVRPGVTTTVTLLSRLDQ